MRISELSRRAGVPLASVKYYLREGLLAPGDPSARNQAAYGDAHLHRLRLIRTLREVGNLEIERIRRIVVAIDEGSASRHELFGVAQRALDATRPVGDPVDPAVREARAQVDAFLDRRGWSVREDASARNDLARAVLALQRLGRDNAIELLAPYADVAEGLAEWEVGTIAASDPPAVAVERMVVGTVVFGAVLDALRRLAHEHESGRRSTDESAARAPSEQHDDD